MSLFGMFLISFHIPHWENHLIHTFQHTFCCWGVITSRQLSYQKVYLEIFHQRKGTVTITTSIECLLVALIHISASPFCCCAREVNLAFLFLSCENARPLPAALATVYDSVTCSRPGILEFVSKPL